MASYLQVENISKAYGDRVLFKDISFNINEGDKIALIAPNGTGKSTLLSILAGADSSDMGGEVKFMKSIKVHFLEQDTHYNPDDTVFEVLFKGSAEVHDAIIEYENALLSGDPDRLSAAMTAMDVCGGWSIEQHIKTVISELDIPDQNKRISTLSGGELKRVALASMILSNADFLVMDEPTNHLDLSTIEYLEEYLGKSRCTLLMVTHDRYFLDRVCTRILELDRGKLYAYNGNYSYFLEKKQEREDNLVAETEKARNLYRTELDWMRRMPCARGTKAKYRIDAFHSLKEKINGPGESRKMDINVAVARVGKKIVKFKDVCHSYGDRITLDHFTYNFARGEKIGIIGRNGVGKTTFLRLITGELQPVSGTISMGETMKVGYYSQSGLKFKEDQTVIELVRDIAETVELSDGSRVPVTTFLNYFLFPPNCHNTKVYKLSGGEKRRLYLLTVLMRSPNFLILDEPTNDLDIVTLNVLEDYLSKFRGPVLIVSHDRYFLDKIADHLFVFTGNGEVKDFPGTYTEYREFEKERELERERAEREKKNLKVQSQAAVQNTAETKKKLSYREKKELEQIEKDLERLASEKAELELKMSSGDFTSQQIQEMSLRYSEISEETDMLEMRWLELSESGN